MQVKLLFSLVIILMGTTLCASSEKKEDKRLYIRPACVVNISNLGFVSRVLITLKIDLPVSPLAPAAPPLARQRQMPHNPVSRHSDPYTVFMKQRVRSPYEIVKYIKGHQNCLTEKNVNTKDRRGLNAARAAALCGCAQTMQKALELKANPNQKINSKEPLIFSARSKKVAELLIDKGADLRVKNAAGKNLLQYLESNQIGTGAFHGLLEFVRPKFAKQ